MSMINSNSLKLFWRIMNNATWRNLHWLPHQILVYEVRVEEGYGMRWSRDCNAGDGNSETVKVILGPTDHSISNLNPEEVPDASEDSVGGDAGDGDAANDTGADGGGASLTGPGPGTSSDAIVDAPPESSAQNQAESNSGGVDPGGGGDVGGTNYKSTGVKMSATTPPQNDDLQSSTPHSRSWKFRGLVEPMMENGHELGWKH
jgi:hypothetical protein